MSRLFVRLARIFVVLVASVATTISAAKAAAEEVVFKFKENAVLSANGDTDVDVTIKIPDEV